MKEKFVLSEVPTGELLEELFIRFAGLVGERNSSSAAAFIDQSDSPLGPRRHCAAVRRRIEQNEGGASIPRKGRYLLTQAALNEELMRDGKSPQASAAKAETNALKAELKGKLRLRRGR